MITAISPIHPAILQFFDSRLLSSPCPKFRDDETDLWAVYRYLKFVSKKKLRNCPRKKQKFKEIERKFLELYEQITQKKEDASATKENKTEGFGYRFRYSSRSDEEIFRRFNNRARTFKHTANAKI
jgi:hypothetical protein